MLEMIVDALVALLGIHALLKFVFFLLPYSKRRDALDRAYAGKPTATKRSDAILLAITLGIAALILLRGVDGTSFLGGLWIGATLIQLYFHRFSEPLSPATAPPPVVYPIKMMSYAIQAEPARPWREILSLIVLILWSLALIGRHFHLF